MKKFFGFIKKILGFFIKAIKKFFGLIIRGIKKLWVIITNKWLLKGTTTIILVAIVIAGYSLINWGVKELKIEDLDFTEKKLYSLSDETKTRLNNLDTDITIQLINMSNESYDYILEYARKYENVSDRIIIEEIEDLSTRVDIQEKYGIDNTVQLIVIKNGEKEKTLTIDDLYTYDYGTSETIDITEEAITNSIVEVTMEEKPKIYVLIGKAYTAPQQSLYTIATKLIQEVNEMDVLDIITNGSVPEDCDCLIITTLAQDLTDFERDKILEYINKGGNLLVLSSQNILEVETPNFDQILAQYGASIDYGVVYEQDANKMITESPMDVIADVSAEFLSDIDMSLRMYFEAPGQIKFAEEAKLEELGVEYETIATTSEKSFVRTNFDNVTSDTRTDKDSEEGSYILGALATKKISDDVDSELIIYSSESTATNKVIYLNAQYFTYSVEMYNNKDIILNSVSHLIEREDTILIRKTLETETYDVTDQEDVIIQTIIFVVPVFVIGLGIVVWYVRRRKV